jgi:hypothetical protein
LADHRNPDGRLISEQLALHVLDDLVPLSKAFHSRLEEMSSEFRAMAKIDRQVLIVVVLQPCEGSVPWGLARQRKIRLSFLKTPNHERQSYTTANASAP